MNHFCYSEIAIGQSESYTLTITEESMENFYKLSGDCSPIHMDDEYARKMGHKGRVVYGMAASSVFSTLAGVFLPGEYCLLHGIDVMFSKPVYIGDTLTAVATVTEKNDLFNEITVKVEVRNQEGKKVIRGHYKAGVVL